MKPLMKILMNIKLVFPILIILLLVQPLTFADGQYQLEDLASYESLTFDITVTSSFDLEETSPAASLNSVTAKLLLKPQDLNSHTTIISESTSEEGEIFENRTEFTFTSLEPLTKEIIYYSTVKIDSSKHIISNVKEFPIQLSEEEIVENNLEEYLEVSDIIDWDNDEIRRQASAIAEGQTDLFESLVAMASWVEQNIEYNLSTLNAESSYPASSVLESREGVCDEMTSLFISFARSLGIPARFVSGLTYTRNDLFDDPWQSHGWAEVYLPEIGWTSFDPTFGQYGFVDSTHIPLQYSSDPTESSIYYEWTANDVELISKDTVFEVEVSNYGPKITDDISIETENFASMVDFGSYNLISANIENQKNSYRAVELELITPEEITSFSEETVVVIIGPEGNYNQDWIVQVESDLKPEYIYTFPYYIIANSKINETNTFSASTFNPYYSYEEIESLISTTEVSLNSEISISCSYENSIYLEDSVQINCKVRNDGNKIIEEAEVCIAEICERIDLLLAETKNVLQGISFEETGFQNVLVSINYEDLSQNDLLSILVLDDANIEVGISAKNEIKYADTFYLEINLDRTSISIPQNISIEISTPSEIQTIDLSKVEDLEILSLEFDSSRFSFENEIIVDISWNDELAKTFNHSETLNLTVEGQSFLDNVRLFINKILLFFIV